MSAFCQIYAQWDQVGDRIDEVADHLFSLGLVCDAAYSPNGAARWGSVLGEVVRRGGLAAPTLYPPDLDAACADPNWWKYSEEECRRLLAPARRRHEALGLGGMDALNTYTPGNALVAACRTAGIEYLLGFCAPIVISDGAWEIAHYGSPLSPYFVSDEDFRKPEVGRPHGRVLMSSMELRNPMVCLNHWSEGPFCPVNAQAVDRWLEPSGDPWPFLRAAEDWLRQAELTGRPLFFHLNLQYFFAGRTYEHNRRALEWLARQRDMGRVEVGSLRQWARFLQQQGGFVPQTTYWRGEMAGYHTGHRPGIYPDVIVHEDLEAQTVWEAPNPLPARMYDYRHQWNCHPFRPDGSDPASTPIGEITLEVSADEGAVAFGRAFRVRAENRGEKRRVPFVIWDGLEGLCSPFRFARLPEGWNVEAVPHPSGRGGAVKVEGEFPAGMTDVAFGVEAGEAGGTRAWRSWGNLLTGQTFQIEGRRHTVVASRTPEPFGLTLLLPPALREPVVVEQLVGNEHTTRTLAPGNRMTVRFDGTRLVSWLRVWDVGVHQIEFEGVGETEALLESRTRAALLSCGKATEVPPPGFQLFGNIRDAGRWDVGLARAAGEREVAAFDEWFREQRPLAGSPVIELHAGVFLPRGSISGVLGRSFDLLRCAEGYGLRPLCYDYPQSWDWGVGAWVQWRQLKFEITGLQGSSTRHALHLHAFDPECRGIVQRVHLFNPAGPGIDEASALFGFEQRRPDIAVVSEWVLPRGIEGRREPRSIVSFVIPEQCHQWPTVGVWVVPLAASKLHDWVAERGAPGLLSHLRLTH